MMLFVDALTGNPVGGFLFSIDVDALTGNYVHDTSFLFY